MRGIFTIAVKDLVLTTRDLLGLFFIIGFPVLMGVFFGSMYGGMGERRESSVEVAVVDDDASPLAAKFVQSLDDADGVNLHRVARQEALDRVRRGELVGMIAIPAGFGETAGVPWMESPAIELGVDPSRQAEGAMLEGLVLQAAGQLFMHRMQDPQGMRPLLASLREDVAADDAVPAPMRLLLDQMFVALDGFMSSLQAVQAAERTTAGDEATDDAGNGESGSDSGFELARITRIDVTHEPAPGSTAALVAKMRSKWDISFPQAMLWGVLGCAAAFAISVVRERKGGTLLRLSAAPITRTQIVLGKALACFLAVLLVIAAMTALGVALGMRPRNPGLLAAAALCVAGAFVGITILMSVIGRTEEAVAGAAWGANMVMAMFGGGMIPLAFMPAFMVPLSQASPVKWSILALEGAIWRGFSPAEMLLPCGILLGIGGVCLALGAVRLARMSD
jgi:ABC-2 type transport system permease protein